MRICATTLRRSRPRTPPRGRARGRCASTGSGQCFHVVRGSRSNRRSRPSGCPQRASAPRTLTPRRTSVAVLVDPRGARHSLDRASTCTHGRATPISTTVPPARPQKRRCRAALRSAPRGCGSSPRGRGSRSTVLHDEAVQLRLWQPVGGRRRADDRRVLRAMTMQNGPSRRPRPTGCQRRSWTASS